jgi:hypothetical protein
MLREFDGQPVDGSYTLSFDATSLSAKLCNTVGGDFSTTDDILHTPQLISTQMFCLDEEANTLEAAFQPDGASFSLVSTRMATNNLERLALTTLEGHIFLYTNILAPIEGLDTAEVLDILQEDAPLIGGQQDEHGCYLGAGYARNEEAQECQRPREQAEDTSGNDEIIQDVEAILNALDENN